MCMSLLHLSLATFFVYQTKTKLLKIEATGLFPITTAPTWDVELALEPQPCSNYIPNTIRTGKTLLTRPSEIGLDLLDRRGKHCLRDLPKMDRHQQCQAVACIYSSYRKNKLVGHVSSHHPKESR